MALALIACGVGAVLILLIWYLTGSSRISIPSDEENIERVISVAELELANAQTDVEADVLIEMLQRMGLDGHDAVAAAGFPMPPASPDGALVVVHRPDDLQIILAEALMLGVQIARIDDDHAGVGDDRLSDEARVDLADTALFGDERRERHTVFGKAALVLQDMLKDERSEPRKDVIASLLRVFDAQIESLQQEIESAMAQIPTQDALLWGDGQDRRMYYFKMGVTNVLRRSGKLESLRHLYQLKGVNYNVEEAFQLAAKECPILALAERVGISFLIGMGPADVQGWVQRALKG